MMRFSPVNTFSLGAAIAIAAETLVDAIKAPPHPPHPALSMDKVMPRNRPGRYLKSATVSQQKRRKAMRRKYPHGWKGGMAA